MKYFFASLLIAFFLNQSALAESENNIKSIFGEDAGVKLTDKEMQDTVGAGIFSSQNNSSYISIRNINNAYTSASSRYAAVATSIAFGVDNIVSTQNNINVSLPTINVCGICGKR